MHKGKVKCSLESHGERARLVPLHLPNLPPSKRETKELSRMFFRKQMAVRMVSPTNSTSGGAEDSAAWQCRSGLSGGAKTRCGAASPCHNLLLQWTKGSFSMGCYCALSKVLSESKLRCPVVLCTEHS